MTTRWSPFFKQLIIIAGLIAAVWLVFRVRLLFIPLVLALLFAYVVALPVNWIERRSLWPRSLVVALVLLSAVLAIVTMSVIVIPSMVGATRSFGATFVNVIDELLQATPRPVTISPSLTLDLGPFYRPVNQWLRTVIEPGLSVVENLQRLFYPFASGAASVVIGAVSSIIWVLFVLIVIFYLVRDGPQIGTAVVRSIPEVWRPELTRLGRELATIWNLFVRGQILLGLIMGLIVWLMLTVLGVRNAPALGLLAGILEFIPGIGLGIAAVPAVLIALFLGSTWLPIPNLPFAILVSVAYLVLGQLDNTYLLPRIVGRRVALHPVVVIIGAAAGAQMAGVLGILLAAPTIASLRLINTYVWRKLFDQEPFPEPESALSRELTWSEQVRERPVRAVLFDLDGTLIETDDHLLHRILVATAFLDPLLSRPRRERLAYRVLMLNERLVNILITLMDMLRLDGLVFRTSDFLRRMQGVRAPDHFVPVDGTLDSLRALGQRRLLLGLVTTRSREDVAGYLDAEWAGQSVLGGRDTR